jgi:hypothetical protein
MSEAVGRARFNVFLPGSWMPGSLRDTVATAATVFKPPQGREVSETVCRDLRRGCGHACWRDVRACPANSMLGMPPAWK